MIDLLTHKPAQDGKNQVGRCYFKGVEAHGVVQQ